MGDAAFNISLLGATLVLLAGLSAPLSALALGFASVLVPIALRREVAWVVSPTMLWVWSLLLIWQFLADLYFVPWTVRDRVYLQRGRTQNSYMHARLQSFARPLLAALLLAALPSALPTQTAAVAGFLGGTAVYWASAWVREQIAMSRGSVILLLAELAKNLTGVIVAALVGWYTPLALGLLIGFIVTVAWWAVRLKREQRLYPPLGGSIAPEDS